MNPIAWAFFAVNASALLLLPRKWAPVPLLVTGCYMTMGQGVHLGPISMPVYRMILAVGLLRVLLRGERLAGRVNVSDKLMVAWGGWVLLASVFHEWAPGSGPVFAAGFIFNITLVYFLGRIWCRDLDELTGVIRIIAVLLVPVALEMVFEQVGQKNLFSVFGGVPEEVYLRDGAIRSQGPFQHPILAGTVGAVCFPLMIGIWRRHWLAALVGVAACLTMVLACASSGPTMSLGMAIAALVMWRYRPWLKVVWILSASVYVGLELAMSRPAYYLISKFDLTGSSTGWHRARLIETAIEHFSEWWLFGTDRTIHWMGSSIASSEQHSDITNYYLWIGVIGGFPATLLMMAMMWRAFRSVGQILSTTHEQLGADRFMIWCLGAGMFAHAGTSISVAYFDQSLIFFWLNVAVLASMHAVLATAPGSAHARSAVPPSESDARNAGNWWAGANVVRHRRGNMPGPIDMKSRIVG
jgi:hypothetical protein